MFLHEQPKQTEVRDQEEVPGLETDCRSSKVPTHFTVPEQYENRKSHGIKANKHKVKRTAQDKQYRKLNKQSKKVKSLQEQYRQLQQQIKQLKQMVEIQMQTINHTMNTDNINLHSPLIPLLSNKNNNNTITKCHNNSKMINDITATATGKLQQLIKKLFANQESIQTANSNYLLLSQVNKEEQAQSMFQINNLQQRIRQLRFLLNTKQDLLAYQLATIQNPQQSSIQNQQTKPVVIDYHMPKKIAMVNLSNMSADYQYVQKAFKQIQYLKSVVVQLEKELQELDYNQVNQNNSKQNEQQQQSGENDYKTVTGIQKQGTIISKGQTDITATPKDNNSNSNSNNNNSGKKIINLSPIKSSNLSPFKSNNVSPFRSNNLSPFKSNRQPSTPTPPAPQLQFLPLSVTNYQGSLIYKVFKLHQLQEQKSYRLKCTYKQLLRQYDEQIEKKKRMVSEYEIQRDIYQYKKKQSLLSINNSSNSMMRNKLLLQIEQESDDDGVSSQQSVNTENILAELKEQQQQHQQSIITTEESNSEEKREIIESRIIIVKESGEQQQVVNQINHRLESINQNDINYNSNNAHIGNNTYTNVNTNTNSTHNSNNKSPFLKLKLKPSSSTSTTLSSALTNPVPTLSKLTQPNLNKENPSSKPKLQLPAYRKDKQIINHSKDTIANHIN